MDYLKELVQLRDRCRARIVSDHLCWTGVDGLNLHDLLPLPYTEEALAHIAERVSVVQDVLGHSLVLENPSTYLEFEYSHLTEWGFLAELSRRTGCGLLLDVNNVYVSATNHGFDADTYLAAMPWDQVAYFHLAGHSVYETHLLDTHDGPVCDDVWGLYRKAHELSGGRSTLMEWDGNIPSFEEVRAEAWKAKAIRGEPEQQHA